MKIPVLLFSHLKQAFGADSLELELPDGATSMDALNELRSRLPHRLSEMPVLIAVNQVYVRDAVVLQKGDEVAVIPPVQGG